MKHTASPERAAAARAGVASDVRVGASAPLGASVVADGVNFSVFSKARDGSRPAAVRPRRRREAGTRDSSQCGGEPYVPLLATVSIAPEAMALRGMPLTRRAGQRRDPLRRGRSAGMPRQSED